MMEATRGKLPDRLVVVAGTYDGVLVGWDSMVKGEESSGGTNDKPSDEMKERDISETLSKHQSLETADSYLKMNFAMAVHDGSVRDVSIGLAPAPMQPTGPNETDNGKGDEAEEQRVKRRKKDVDSSQDQVPVPGMLVSAGYDESLAFFSLTKLVQKGELKTPSNLGTPACTSFAPPSSSSPTHALVGFSDGTIAIYKKSDWTVQHVLRGHDDKGVSTMAVHPSGKMALSGGRDSKLILWDLMRGRLSFVFKINKLNKGRKDIINHIVWSDDGEKYAYCTHEGNVTVRDMNTGEDLLDITLPSRANQICFIGGRDGIFLAAACDDGSLPVMAVGGIDESEEEIGARRAIMAIDPVEGVPTAGDERFKCIQSVQGGSGFLVVTANSGGVVSLIDLEGAARIMLVDDSIDDSVVEEGDESNKKYEAESSDSEDEDDEELAAEILESVKIGSGARITAIAAWGHSGPQNDKENMEVTNTLQDAESSDVVHSNEKEEDDKEVLDIKEEPNTIQGTLRTIGSGRNRLEIDAVSLNRARALVGQAKMKQQSNKKKKKKKKGKRKSQVL